MKIFLIGMPGSGKSTLGKRIAARLGYQFKDLDSLIEAEEDASIPTVFAQKGEPYFRSLESSILKSTNLLENIVLATGGGTPCYFDNMEWMREHGLTVWLNVSPATIAARINGNRKASQQRPLFAGKTEEEIIATLMAMHQKRLPFYQRAKLHIDEHEATTVVIMQKIKDLMANRP